jgi:ubiquinone/menaquinone biosynthesis C-methylase UbiE
MHDANIDLRQWERIEVERSAVEALRRSNEFPTLSDAVIQRYSEPDPRTPFALEYAYSRLGDVRGKTVLDFGCGAGENSVLIASHGGDVIGVDISPELIGIAEKRMKQRGLDRCRFMVGSAHGLPLPDSSVDVVFGMAILHHLDLKLASTEVFRVLRKGGRAIFMDPVRNSKMIRLLRDLVPYTSPDVSPNERPLTDGELTKFCREFSSVATRSFSLPFINLIEAFGLSGRLLDIAIKFDGRLLRYFPFLNYYASVRVLEAKK